MTIYSHVPTAIPIRIYVSRCALCLLTLLALSCPALHSQPRPGFDKLSQEADAARDANHLDEAVGLYQQALALRPDWKEGWWSLGTIEYDRSQYAEAKRALEKVVAQDPESGTARLMLGLSEFELGEDEAALREIERAKTQQLTRDPQMLNVMFFDEGVLLRRSGKFEASANVLEDLCAQQAEDPEIVRELGMLSLRLRDKAYPAPSTPMAEVVGRLGEARCRVGKNQFDAARQIAQTVAAQFPQVPNVHYAYGRILLDSQDPTAAVKEFELEIANQPNDVYSRLEIAAARYRVDSAAGIPYAEDAVRLNPRLPFGHYMLGLLLLDAGQYQNSVPQLELAKASFPDDPRVYFALANAYTHVGRRDDAATARAEFRRLTELQGKHPRTRDYGVGVPSAPLGGSTAPSSSRPQ